MVHIAVGYASKHYLSTTMTYLFDGGRMVSFIYSGRGCLELQDALSSGEYAVNTVSPWGERLSVESIHCGAWERRERVGEVAE